MDVKREPRFQHGSENGESRWATVRRAVQQHKVLQCFRTLRQMSDGFLVDFEHLKHVCTLGEGTYGAVDKRILHHSDGTHSVYAVKHLRSQAKIAEMSAMDIETTVRTIERVASLALHSQSSKTGLSFPGCSLPELQPVPDYLSDGGSGLVATAHACDRFTPRSGLVGMPMPPQPLGFSMEGPLGLPENEKDAQGCSGDAHGDAPACLEVASRGSSCFSHRGAAPQPTTAENAQISRIVSRMSADDRLFMAELHVMRKLSHPYIIRYLGCGVSAAKGPPGSSSTHYISIAQECCEGGSIARLIRRASLKCGGKRLFSYHDAWRWSLQTAKALKYMHESNPRVLHRDLKAENLLLSSPGRGGDIRVVDFGLAKLCGGAQKQHERYHLTGQTGSFLYMAPEVLRCEPYNEKVDIFSLGVIMYELFAMCPIVARIGRPDQAPSNADPYERESFAHRVADGFRLELKPSWPPSLQEIIARCWHADAERRPSATRLVHMLKNIEEEIESMDACCKRNVVAAEPRLPAVAAAAAGPQGSCCTIF